MAWWDDRGTGVPRLGWIGLGVALLMLVGMVGTPPCAADGPSLAVEPTARQVALSETFSVTVVISGVVDLQSLDLRLQYDPTVLQVQDANPSTPQVEIAPGELYTSAVYLLNQADNDVGRIDYSVAADASPPYSGTASVAVVAFQGIAPGSSALTFSMHDLWSGVTQTITHTVGEGWYTVAPPVYLPAIRRNHHTGYELIEKGDCEGEGGWFFRPTMYTGGYSSLRAHTGVRSLRTGIEAGGTQTYSYSSATQLVDVPAASHSMRLSFWVSMDSLDGPTDTKDQHYVLVIDPWLNYHYLVFRQGASEAHQPAWTQYVFDESLLDAFKGQQVQLHVETHNDGFGARSVMYVDDVSWLYWP